MTARDEPRALSSIPGTGKPPLGTTCVRRLALVASSLLLACLFSVGSAAGADMTLFIAWHAPYGTPGATDTLTGLCNDKGADTLYLSFDPGEKMQAFMALQSTIVFHTAPQDSFSTRWLFGGGAGNAFNVRVESGPKETFPAIQPWKNSAVGGVNFDHTAHHGFLRVLLAQPSTDSTVLVPGKRYCFARLFFPHPPEVEGCHQPICIEFKTLKVNHGMTDLVSSRGEHRFISINSRNGEVCDAQKTGGNPKPEVWTPWKRP